MRRAGFQSTRSLALAQQINPGMHTLHRTGFIAPRALRVRARTLGCACAHARMRACTCVARTCRHHQSRCCWACEWPQRGTAWYSSCVHCRGATRAATCRRLSDGTCGAPGAQHHHRVTNHVHLGMPQPLRADASSTLGGHATLTRGEGEGRGRGARERYKSGRRASLFTPARNGMSRIFLPPCVCPLTQRARI